MALCGLAGPVANLLLAFVILLPFEILAALLNGGILVPDSEFSLNLITVTIGFIRNFHFMNITLAIFNFIPVPPLDGSRVLWAVLPDKLYFGVMRYERYISMALMLLLVFGILDMPLTIAASALSRGMQWVWGLLPFFG
jgi:Zn-dependent protease